MKIVWKSGITFVFFIVLTLAATANATNLDSFRQLTGHISIAGGTAHVPVMNELARRIMQYNSNIQISVSGGGSSIGIKKVGEGQIDIGNSGRALNEEEKRTYDITSIPFAIDGIAVVVHPSNPVSNLTTEQAEKIFSGEITNWQEVGGSNSPIKLYGRDANSATREVFWEKLLNKGPISAATNIIDSNNSMKIVISWDRAGIGYMGIGMVNDKIKALSINGIEPSQENARSTRYFVVRKLYSNITKSPSMLTQLFIAYLQSPEGREVTSAAGYIPVN